MMLIRTLTVLIVTKETVGLSGHRKFFDCWSPDQKPMVTMNESNTDETTKDYANKEIF